ncbi:Sterol 3-beta-glucosyltransferase, partial [Tulasnella sp. 427]
MTVPGEARSTAASEASSRAETPPPVAYPSRAAFGALGAFKGDGSMRAGTQTLIQALQAIPWEEDRDEDAPPRPSMGPRRSSAVSSGSEDEDEGRRGQWVLVDNPPHQESSLTSGPASSSSPSSPLLDFMASSIHAIYRPVARSNRGTPATARPHQRGGKPRPGPTAEGYFGPTSESEAQDDELDDLEEEEEENHEDFDLATRPPLLPLAAKYDPNAPSPIMSSYSGNTRLLTPDAAPLVASPVSGLPPKSSVLSLPNPARQDSLATVRAKRKARLAEKLREVFGLKEVEEVIVEMPCWLLRSVLLQGYMYLTSGHLCFFAHMPAREDPYFPHGNVDLRYAITCEAYGERDFKLRTNQKTLHLQADSIPSRDEWVKAIKKVIFKAQNHGDS